MKKLSSIGIIIFLSLFLYFFKKSGKFRLSIKAAIVGVSVFFSVPAESKAKDVNAFGQQVPQHQRNRRALGSSSSGNNNPGNPSGAGGDGDDFGDGMPEFPNPGSV